MLRSRKRSTGADRSLASGLATCPLYQLLSQAGILRLWRGELRALSVPPLLARTAPDVVADRPVRGLYLDSFLLSPNVAYQPVACPLLSSRTFLESWRQIEENPAQLEQAAHPIPYPPASRLNQGTLTLPRVRAGQVELSVELDDGTIYRFIVPVSPGKMVVLALP